MLLYHGRNVILAPWYHHGREMTACWPCLLCRAPGLMVPLTSQEISPPYCRAPAFMHTWRSSNPERTRLSASVTVPKVPRPPVFIALYTLLPHETGLTYVTKRMLWKCQWVSSEVLKCTAASTLLS